MNSETQIISNPEIKSALLTIYDKIGMNLTREVGYELFIDLILNNIYHPVTINFIITQVGNFINSLDPKEKEPYLKLLSLIFYNPNQQGQEDENKNSRSLINKNAYYEYLSPILNVIQLLINEEDSELFPSISNIYAEIVQNTLPSDISASTRKLNIGEKKAYEILQGFCIYNMKYDDNSNRIVGSLCLTKLVENCPIVLQNQYTKFIWDNINSFIDKKSFNAKYELLNCLISLILGTENLFCPYANVTLYKVLDFLTDNDWLKRKLALNVIYTLIFYCKEEIMPLKEHIINFLRVLKTDKVKEVREVCLLILKIFSENEPKKEKQPENYSIFSEKKIHKERKNNSNSKKVKERKNNINEINKDNKEIKNFDYDDKITNNAENQMEKSKKYEFNEDKEKDNNRPKTPIGRKKNIGDEGNNNFINHKLINRKDNNTFINEKMKIRPDPNKSIFRTSPNSAFFNQTKNKKDDIIIMAKGDPKKYDYNIKEEKIKGCQSSSNKKKSINNSQTDLINNSNNFNGRNLEKKNEVNTYENLDENKIFNNKYNYNKEIRTKYNKNKDREDKKNMNKKLKENFKKNNSDGSNNKNTKNIFNKKNKKFDSILVNKLLSQMNNLSIKQLSLIDAMEKIQIDAQQQIKALNNKIIFLNSLVDDLTSELEELREQNN